MTTTSPIAGLPAPGESSPNDPPIHFQALNDVLDPIVVPRFTSTGARNTAFANYVTAGGVMKDGMPCRVDGVGFMFYDLSAATWRTAASTNDISALVLPRLVAISSATAQFNSTGNSEQRVTGNITIATAQALQSGRMYRAEFKGRAWAPTGVQVALRIKVGTQATLTVSNISVAVHQSITDIANATDASDVKFDGVFAVQTTGTYGVALFGKCASGTFAVGADDRGKYELILSDCGPSVSGLTIVT